MDALKVVIRAIGRFLQRGSLALTAIVCAHDVVHAQDFTQLGGDLTSDMPPHFAVTLPSPNMTSQERHNFHLNGFVSFNHSFAQDLRDGKPILGPTFNHDACGSCHIGDGKGSVSFPRHATGSQVIIKVGWRGLNRDRSPRDIRGVGEQLQDHTISGKRRYNIRLKWREVKGKYPDGRSYSLRAPVLSFKIPGVSERRMKRVVHSIRMTPPIIGMGLLEAVPAETIQGMADPGDLNRDGISGRVSYVPNRETGRLEVGRFGFRASHPTVKQQSAAAFFNDMGLTNELFQDPAHPQEISAEELEKVTFYQQVAGVHKARQQTDPNVVQGRILFQQVGCHDCHTMTLTTGPSPIPELSYQTFHPFTDLLLHDMGPDLADGRAEFSATGREWKTTPLWGLGVLEMLNDNAPRFLHDGRARSLEEAILWHGGEARRSRDRFKQLSFIERDQLVQFLRSL